MSPPAPLRLPFALLLLPLLHLGVPAAGERLEKEEEEEEARAAPVAGGGLAGGGGAGGAPASPLAAAAATGGSRAAAAKATSPAARQLPELLASTGSNGSKRMPTVAYHLLCYNHSQRPLWATEGVSLHMYAAQESCAKCSRDAPTPSFSRYSATDGWWCTQRNYMPSLRGLLQEFPNKDYYMLLDADAVAFPKAMDSLLQSLEHHVLSPEEDLYMGHGFSQNNGVPRFIMTGAGALVRGRTLRRLVQGPYLQKCINRHQGGDWCWHHLDWVLGECLLDMGVEPTGHTAFQSFIDICPGCCERSNIVACHPAKTEEATRKLRDAHENQHSAGLSQLAEDWARPCTTTYNWKAFWESECLPRRYDGHKKEKIA